MEADQKDLRNRKTQLIESPEEDYLLEDLYDAVDFDFDLNGVHSDVGNLFQKFAKKEVIRASLKKQVMKAEKSLMKQNTKIKQVIKSKNRNLKKSLQHLLF